MLDEANNLFDATFLECLAGFPTMWHVLFWVMLDDVEPHAQQMFANNVGTLSWDSMRV